MNQARGLKVLHLTWSLETGGLERVALDLARGARALGVTPLLASLERGGDLAEQAKALGMEVLFLGKRPGIDLGVAGRLRRELLARRVDILHAHNQAPAFYGGLAARLSGIPAVCTRHGASFGKSYSHQWLSRLGARLCRYTVCVGQDARQVALSRDRTPESRLRLIYNGVDTDAYRPDERARQQVRAELGLSPGQPVLISVGRLSPEKDYPSLLRALASLPQPAPVLLLVGDGSERAALEELARQLDCPARLLGLRQDVPRLLGAADVFVLPSLSEGISIAILEAMACGLPVLATAVGGNPELVADGLTGMLTPPAQPQALAAALSRLLEQPETRQAMGQAARQTAQSRFSLRAAVQSYVALYRDALNRSEGQP